LLIIPRERSQTTTKQAVNSLRLMPIKSHCLFMKKWVLYTFKKYQLKRKRKKQHAYVADFSSFFLHKSAKSARKQKEH
jgi:hypothetical protein